MKYHEHERILPGETAPTPDQLRELALIGTRSAARRSRLRRVREDERKKQERIKKGGLNPPVFYAAKTGHIKGEVEGGEPLRQLNGRISAHVTDEGEKMWHLKFINIQDIETIHGETVGERTTYMFEWTKTRVELARRVIQAYGHETIEGRKLGGGNLNSLMDEIDHFSVDDDIAQQWQLEIEMEEITGVECDDLISDARQYFARVDHEHFEKEQLRQQALQQETKIMALNHEAWMRADDDRVDEQMWRSRDPNDE